jgi:TolC family type I secretion outer membrane protein
MERKKNSMRKAWSKEIMGITAAAAAAVFLLGNSVWAAPVELTLEQSVEMALRQNPSIEVAEAQLSGAQADVSKAKGAFGPTLKLSASGTYLDAPSSTSGSRESYDSHFSLSLPIYTGGGLEGSLGQAKAARTYYNKGVDKTKQQLVLDVTTAYYNILQAKNIVKLSEESVTNTQSHVNNTQAFFQAGTVPKSDVLRAEVELAQVKQDLIKAQNSYDVAIAAFNNLLGLNHAEELVLIDPLTYTKRDISLEESISKAMLQRPEIKQAEAQVQGAEYGVKAAKSGHKPSLSLNGNLGWKDSEFPPDNEDWSVTLSAGFNIFDSNVTSATVKKAQSNTQQMRASLRKTKDDINLEVRQSYLNTKEAEERINTATKAQEKAEEDLHIAHVRYSAGVGTNIEVLDAQVALTQAKTNYTAAIFDYNVGLAKLRRAIGDSI